MAAIASSAVTLLESNPEGTRSGKERGRLDRVAIVLSAQGATLGDIPASVLGFAEIFWAWCVCANVGAANSQVSVAIDSTTTVIGVMSQSILTYTQASASPANVTGTIVVEIYGRSL